MSALYAIMGYHSKSNNFNFKGKEKLVEYARLAFFCRKIFNGFKRELKIESVR